MAISSPQNLWTLFVGPIGKALGGSLAALQVTFLLLIVLQTFLSPFQAIARRAIGATFRAFCKIAELAWFGTRPRVGSHAPTRAIWSSWRVLASRHGSRANARTRRAL